MFRRRKQGPLFALAAAADVSLTAYDDPTTVLARICVRTVLAESSRRECVAAAIEDLLCTPSSYQLVMTFVEYLQNATSHGLPRFCSPEAMRTQLGAHGLIAWQTLTHFWSDVADWAALTPDLPAPPDTDLASIANPELEALLVVMVRRTDRAGRIGIGEAAIYEARGFGGLPNYSHLQAVRDVSG